MKVNLPLNIPVLVDVDIKPGTAGIHSAILQLDDPTTVGIDYMTMNTVYRAATTSRPPTASRSAPPAPSGATPRSTTSCGCPSGASALKVDMTGGGAAAGAGQIRFLRFTPQGLGVESPTRARAATTPTRGPAAPAARPTAASSSTRSRASGRSSWRRAGPPTCSHAPFSITASVLGAAISPNPDVVASAQLSVPQVRDYTVTNLFGDFTGRLVGGGALSSTQTQRPTVGNLATVRLRRDTPSGRVAVRHPDAATLRMPRADIDLVVFRCSAPNVCTTVVGSSGGATAVEQVTLNNPVAATYRILVDGFSVPEGTTEFDLIDSWTSAALGTVTSSDADALRPAGSSWNAQATLTVLADPGAGRKITGTLRVVTDAGTNVGSGSIVVDAVTP